MGGLEELKVKIASSAFFKSPFYLKYHQFVIPVVVMVVAILISVLVTMPQLFKYFETRNNISELEQKKLFLEQKVARLESINLTTTRNDLDTALVALPVDKDIPGVIGQLLVALSSSGMSLDGITFSGTSIETEKVGEYTVKMEVSGSEEGLKNFLERIKLTPRSIILAGLDISKARIGKLSASVTLVTSYESLPAEIGLVEDKVPELNQVDSQILSDIQTKLRLLPQNSSTSSQLTKTGKLNPFAK